MTILRAASCGSSSSRGLTKADMTGTEVASTTPLRSTMSARSDWIEPPRAATRCVGSRAVAQQRHVAHAQADRDERHGEDRRGDDEALARRLLRIALEALLRRPVTRAGRRVCRGGRFGRGRPAPQPHRRPPSFRERISSIETAALWPSPSGPDVAGSWIGAGRGGVVGPVERAGWGAEAGEGLPASAATRPPPGKLDEGTSLPVRGGEGSGGSRRGGTDSGLERIEPDDLLDRGRLELEMLDGEPLDALGLVEVSPFDPQDVRGLLALDDLLVGAVDLLLEVLHLVLDGEQADRRGDGGDRPEQESAMDHARPPSAASFSATRRRAERARGLAAISAADGSTGLRVRSPQASAARSSARGGAWRDGPGVRPARARTNSLTARSSSEWNETTASRPPGASTCSAAASPRSSSPSSSFTAMRSAWKVRVAGSLSSLPCGPTARRTISASSPVVSMRLLLARLDDGARDAAAAAAPRRSAR